MLAERRAGARGQGSFVQSCGAFFRRDGTRSCGGRNSVREAIDLSQSSIGPPQHGWRETNWFVRAESIPDHAWA